jgi:hypothetical protein
MSHFKGATPLLDFWREAPRKWLLQPRSGYHFRNPRASARPLSKSARQRGKSGFREKKVVRDLKVVLLKKRWS